MGKFGYYYRFNILQPINQTNKISLTIFQNKGNDLINYPARIFCPILSDQFIKIPKIHFRL